MTSNRPYLLRAIYEWILDNDMTPYLLVNAEYEDTFVPIQFVENGRIILNLSPSAVRSLELNNDCVTFNARFSGKVMDVYIPIGATLAIYSQESTQGMVFSEEDEANFEQSSEQIKPPKKGKPTLKIVK
ncbi:MAG: ClpXP protease specificity-enhancing factor [Methylococcales bacterium]|nr:ClpXP protease specificity-enhancing factor [Methylococcales bacterium]MBT7408448.1 ClpXP protease specificity-enhancing factor [Methylococcales bacterium]